MERITLSEKQQEAADAVVDWLETDEKVFAIAGYAGSGKTTIGRWLQDEIGGASFCAYTNKAANVLRSKGCREVTTIHKAIYEPTSRDKTELHNLRAELQEAKERGNAFDVARLKRDLAQMEEEMAKPAFKVQETEGKRPFKIVDEYSMVNQEVFSDLTNIYEKVLYFGDPFQLSPIGNTERSKEKAYCPVKPNIILTEIHRQAEDSNILHAAKLVREMKTPQFCDWGDFRCIPRHALTDEDLLAADQVICGYNRTRHEINDWYRKQYGYRTPLPRAGEIMMCVSNHNDVGLYNGMILEVVQDAVYHPVKSNAYLCKFKGINVDLVDGEQPIECWIGELTGEQFRWADKSLRSLKRFSYCHAITCHKSQGSEYDNLIVFNEPVGDDATEKAKWLYTAITRGKKKVTLVQG